MLKRGASRGAMALKKTRSICAMLIKLLFVILVQYLREAGLFDMNKLLSLERWEIMPITEREAFSDTD